MPRKAESTQVSAAQLQLDRLEHLIKKLEQVLPASDEFDEITKEMRERVKRQLVDYSLSLRIGRDLKLEYVDAFLKRPYRLIPVPRRRDTWELHVPRFVPGSWGYCIQQDDAWNVFLVNRYMDWLGELPEAVKKQLGFKTPLPLELKGDYLTGPRNALDQAHGKYRSFIKKREEKGLVINKKRAFELIAALVKDGILPFTVQNVPKEDLIERPVDFTLRPYQKDAWKTFLKYSNIGVFYPASVGKTMIGIWAMTHLKPPHLVVVPTRILQEQWNSRIEAHTDLKPEEYTVCTYHAALRKYGKRNWGLLIIDETHHLPSNQFSKLSLIPHKYTMGLTASPQREDQREEYIFALTGKPVGLGWEYFRKLDIIQSPVCNVWIVKTFTAKLLKIGSLLAEKKKTLVFSDSIEIGKTIAKRFDLPFVYGQTGSGRLAIIDEAMSDDSKNPAAVVSRVADEGVSLPEIEMVIEASWLYGSRRQELQRFTRLLHSQKAVGEHHILMTLDEYLHDRKRLFSIMDKGFDVRIHREGVTEKTIAKRLERGYRSPIRTPRQRKQREIEETPPPIMPGIGSSLLQTRGVQSRMKRLNGSEQRFWTILIQNDGSWFNAKKLAFLLGYSSVPSMRNAVNPSSLVKRKWIQQKRVKRKLLYRTNIRAEMQ